MTEGINSSYDCLLRKCSINDGLLQLINDLELILEHIQTQYSLTSFTVTMVKELQVGIQISLDGGITLAFGRR
jgi:hypothetical protein